MIELYTNEELTKLGFSRIGADTRISKEAKFYTTLGELGDKVRIDTYAICTGEINLSDYVHISPFCFLGGTGGKIIMGAYSGISTHVSIFTKSDDYSTNRTGTAKKLFGDVVIGQYSIIGSGTKILPGVKIGNFVSIGCNCVINRDIPDHTIIISRASALLPITTNG